MTTQLHMNTRLALTKDCTLVPALLLAVVSLLASGNLMAAEPASPIKIGMIGLDTSHVLMFTKTFNDPNATGDMAGAKVVAAYPGGSDDLPASRDRVKDYTKQVAGMGVEIVDSIAQLLPKVDVVMLESVDGRRHLEQAREVILAGKPLFIDKPLAASLADGLEIFRLAQEHKVPCFSSSKLRFGTAVQDVRTGKKKVGKIMGCDACGTSNPIPHHPDLYFYDIHGVEMLYTLMGRGCVSVTRVQTPYTEQIVGVWEDGRVGTYRGVRDRSSRGNFGVTVFGKTALVRVEAGGEDKAIVAELLKFFKTGKPPVSMDDTIEILAFLDAAEESKLQGGKSVLIADVLKKAQAAAAAKSTKAE
jgi:predicted dehydrogenase